MCNGEPGLRMGGPHYLSCLCSQPVLFRCSRWISHVYTDKFHSLLVCEWPVYWLPLPTYNDIVKVDSRPFWVCLHESCMIHHSNLLVEWCKGAVITLGVTGCKWLEDKRIRRTLNHKCRTNRDIYGNLRGTQIPDANLNCILLYNLQPTLWCICLPGSYRWWAAATSWWAHFA